MKELEKLKIANAESDVIDTITVLKKEFTVSIGKGGFDYNWGYIMYTDGSKTKNGVGAGICYMRDDEVLIRENIGLPRQTYSRPNSWQYNLPARHCKLIQYIANLWS